MNAIRRLLPLRCRNFETTKTAKTARVAAVLAGVAAAFGTNVSGAQQVATAPAARQSAAESLPKLPTGAPRIVGLGMLSAPETALWDDQADVYLVSNINGPMTVKDDNGFISRISPSGEIMELRWIDGAREDVELHAPKGMIFVGDELWVADIGGVRVFDRNTGKPKPEHAIPDSYLLNGIAAAPDGKVYVTDSGGIGAPAGAVYVIDGQGPGKAIARGGYLERPDGIVADDQGLLIAPYADTAKSLYRLSYSGDRTPFMTLPTPQLDGLFRMPDGSMIVTSWRGQAVYRVQGKRTELVVDSVMSPAQIGYDAKRKQLLVPSPQANELLVVPLTGSGAP
jgi:sugar lactone lactonase YvrE